MEWLFIGAFGLLWIGGIALWIFALVDCIRVPDDSMYRSGTKLIWVLVIVLTQVIGAIIYLVVGPPEPGTRPSGVGVPPPPPPRI
jgi:hypothetical protein